MLDDRAGNPQLAAAAGVDRRGVGSLPRCAVALALECVARRSSRPRRARRRPRPAETARAARRQACRAALLRCRSAAVACRIWVSASSLRSIRRTRFLIGDEMRPELISGRAACARSSRALTSAWPPTSTIVTTCPRADGARSGDPAPRRGSCCSRSGSRRRGAAASSRCSRTPLMYVPLFDPRSSSVQPSPSFHSRACCRDTRMSGTKIWQSERRPMTYSPSPSL